MRHSPSDGLVILSAEATSSTINFMIDDSGPGIDPADLPHIFDRFYRADRSRSRQGGGSGLGLAIARSIAKSHGGELTAANRPAGGARFVLRLPIG
jgi:signal transduction histidine kinase